MKTPLLTQQYKEKRMQFAEMHEDEAWHDWDFSDEKPFEVGGTKGNEKK